MGFKKNAEILKPSLLLYISVFFGRKLMSLWMGEAKIHELYTAACGLYVCWLMLRIGTVLYNWIPQGTAAILNKLKQWLILVSI
jgi:E3 ubiquitin-protein ligase MARCH6